jgi:hypothetical protein
VHTRNDDDPEGSTYDQREVHDLARQKFALDQQYEALGRRRATLRDRMLEAVRAHGQQDRNGNLHLTLVDEIPVGDKRATGLHIRRSARHSFDEDAARALAERKGILDLVQRAETTTYIDQDALWQCQQQGLVDAEDLDALITTTYTAQLWGTYR